MEPQVQKEMETLLQSEQGVNVKLAKILELLTQNGLAYQSCLKVTDLLCHPENRGGSMVQAHDCWKKGALILASGLKESLLHASSMCIEMGKGATKKMQVEKNNALMQSSENLLGHVTHSERYLTLGNSHFCMFLRACEQGCVSPAGEKLALGEDLTKLIANGWLWTVVKAEVEEAFPGFPRWAASTLNSANSNTKRTSELEAMLEIANLLKQGKKLDECVKAVKEGLPTCGDYMDDIAYFVKLYSGEDAFPVLLLLKDFCFLDSSLNKKH